MWKGTVGSMDSGPLNRVVYEGATNTTFTCKGNFAYMDWMVFPFTYTGPHNRDLLTTNGQLKPSYNKLFAIDLSQGKEVYTFVLFNATIFPTDGAPFPTAGLYYCLTEDSDDLNQLSNDFYAHLVVIRKYEPINFNYLHIQQLFLRHVDNSRRDIGPVCDDSLDMLL